MAMQKVVVVTPQAFEGISAHAQQELMVAADDGAFIECILGALADPGTMAVMGARARQRILLDYRWENSLQRLGRLLQNQPLQDRTWQARSACVLGPTT